MNKIKKNMASNKSYTLTLTWRIFIVAMICSMNNAFKAGVTKWLKQANITNISCEDDISEKGELLESDGMVNMQCADYEGISLVDVYWGRKDKVTCQTNERSKFTHKEICDVEQLRPKILMKLKCEGEQICRIPLYFFDHDICPHIRKYLEVTFHCCHMSGMKRAVGTC